MKKSKGKLRTKKRKNQRTQDDRRRRAYRKSFLDRILKWDNPILSMECENVEKEEDIVRLKKDMGRILSFSKNGIGLSASQIGVLKNVILVLMDKKNPTFFINPEIISHSDEIIKSREGCLSYPGYNFVINRFKEITLKYEDESRNIYEEKFEGINSIIIQHEIGHIRLGDCDVGAEWKRLRTRAPIEESEVKSDEQEEVQESIKIESVSSDK